MKIALAVNVWDSRLGSGATTAVANILDQLTQSGIQTIIITTGNDRRINISQYNNTKIYTLPASNLYWVGEKDKQNAIKKIVWQLIDIWNPIMFTNIRLILQEEQPDLVHVHKMRGFSTAIWTAASRAGIERIVQTCQDYELLSPEGTLTTRVGQWSSKGRWFMQPYTKLRARISTVVKVATSPSCYTLNKLVSHGFFKKAEKRIIRNSHGLTKSQIEELRSRRLSQQKTVVDTLINLLFIGRLEKNKGVDWLCNLFAAHCDQWPHLRLHIAGDGQLRTELEHKFGSNRQIVFHGWLDGTAKQELLSRSHLVLVPSTYEEISPVVISEAYAYGIPILGSQIGGIPELVEEGKTGWCRNHENPSEWKDLIETIARHPCRLLDMTDYCTSKALEFTPDQIGNDYINIYLDSKI